MALQPEEQAAPFHPLLPPRPGLYHLDHPLFRKPSSRPSVARGVLSAPRAVLRAARGRAGEVAQGTRREGSAGEGQASGSGSASASEEAKAKARRELRSAQLAFLNNPHPLEILADPGSYGTEGSISRDHDPRHYTFALAAQARRVVREARREERQMRRAKHWLPLLQPPTSPAGSLPEPQHSESEARRAAEHGMEEGGLLPAFATEGSDAGGVPAVAPRGLPALVRTVAPSLSVGRFKVVARRGGGETEKREGRGEEGTGRKGTQEIEVLPPPPPAPMGRRSPLAVRWGGGQRGLAVAAGAAGAGSTGGALAVSNPAIPNSPGSSDLQHSAVTANARPGRSAWGWWFFGRRGDQGSQGQHMLSLLVLLAAAAASNPELFAVLA